EVRKHLQHRLELPFAGTADILDAEQKVLAHRKAREDIAVLRHIAQSADGKAGNVLAFETDRPVGRYFAHDRLHGGGAADTIAPKQAYHLAGGNIQVDALEDVTF